MPTTSRGRKNNRNSTRKRGRGYGRGRERGRERGRGRGNGQSSTTEAGLAGSLVGASALTQGSEIGPDPFANQDAGENNLMFGGRQTASKRRPGCANDIAAHILCFLELLNTIKIYHWSTLSYPTHKATDELHTKLSELVDSFIEIYIGHCARGAGAGAGVPVFRFKPGQEAFIEFCECKSLEAFCKVLHDNIVHMEGLTDRLNGYTDLVNIRDEMVGTLAQALYLLRLK